MYIGNLKLLFKRQKIWKLAFVPIVLLLSAFSNGSRYTDIPLNIGSQVWNIAFQDSLHNNKSQIDSSKLKVPMSLNESATAQVAYMMNCHPCHGVDRMGASAPSLYKLNIRVSFNDFKKIVTAGRAQMPGFRLMDEKTMVALYKYLSDVPLYKDKETDRNVEKKQ